MMALKALTLLLVAATSAAATSTSHVSISLGNGDTVLYSNTHTPSHHIPVSHPSTDLSSEEVPSYRPTNTPSYKSTPPPSPEYPVQSYRPALSYRPTSASSYHHEPEVPACSKLTIATYCVEDEEYPEYEIKHAIQYHLDKFNRLYADVADLNTELSVERLDTLEEETYLCPSSTAYVRPLRAINTEGKWRIIVNEIELHYKTFTQTARVEECLTPGDACPKVSLCYESACLQKSIYHRFLVYDPYDQYFPFAIETFKLPASCACLVAAYTID